MTKPAQRFAKVWNKPDAASLCPMRKSTHSGNNMVYESSLHAARVATCDPFSNILTIEARAEDGA
jgi:hypothetical protein